MPDEGFRFRVLLANLRLGDPGRQVVNQLAFLRGHMRFRVALLSYAIALLKKTKRRGRKFHRAARSTPQSRETCIPLRRVKLVYRAMRPFSCTLLTILTCSAQSLPEVFSRTG